MKKEQIAILLCLLACSLRPHRGSRPRPDRGPHSMTNSGSSAGDAVVQMYVKHLGSKVERAHEELEGFKRVTIEPNETKTVEIPLKASSLAWWDEKLPGFRVEAEAVRVMVGNSSSDTEASTTVKVQ